MHWIKDGQRFSGVLVQNGRRIFNPSDADLLAAGYQPVAEPETPEAPLAVKRYSTLKIIRQLQDDWGVWRAKLEQAGVLDQFLAANYLRADDPVMAEFIARLTPTELAQLSECEITEE